MRIWRAFLGEFDERQKTVERVASREPSIGAQKQILESGKQAEQGSTSGGHPAASAGTIRGGRRCPRAGGGKPTRRQATPGEKSWRSVEVRRGMVRFDGLLFVASTCNPLQGNISVAFSSGIQNRNWDGTEMQQKVRRWPN
jgi:hypothetical protein